VYLSLNLIPQFILDNIKVDIIYCKEFIFWDRSDTGWFLSECDCKWL
jgi:hypothetical protein